MTRIRQHSNADHQAVTYFISDLHLAAHTPKITQTLETFLHTKARHADALYILGDLFDYWLGDNSQDPFEQSILQLLKDFTDTGVPTYFIHGNRDFLIGRHFAKQTGIQLLPSRHTIKLYGTPVSVMHGDTLCTFDRYYQAYRWFMNLSVVATVARFVPRKIRQSIAKGLRDQSRRHQNKVADYLLDVNPATVEKVMQDAKVNQLIHGHTHRPKIHHLEVQHKKSQRIVLGAWHNAGSALAYYADGHFELQDLPFK